MFAVLCSAAATILLRLPHNVPHSHIQITNERPQVLLFICSQVESNMRDDTEEQLESEIHCQDCANAVALKTVPS